MNPTLFKDAARQDLRHAIERTVSRTVALFSLALFVIVAGLQASTFWAGTRAALARDADYLAADLSDRFKHWQRALGITAAELDGLACADWDCASVPLARLVAREPEFVSAIVTDRQGRVIAAAVAEGLDLVAPEAVRGVSVADRDYFIEVERSAQPYVSGVLEGRGFGDDVIVALSMPLFDAQQQLRGVIEVSVTANGLGRLADAVLARMDFAGSAISIVDRRGRVLVLRGSDPQQADPAADAGVFGAHWGPAARAPMQEGFTVQVSASGSGLLAPLWGEAAFVLCCGLVLLLLLRRAIRVLAARLAQPLESLADTLSRVEIGDISGGGVGLLPEGAWKEAQAIQRALLVLIGRTQAAMDEARQASRDLARANAELEAALRERDAVIDRQTRRLKEALSDAWQAAEARARLIANTSHEIRTPLNGMLGTTELLLRTDGLSPSQRQLLQVQQSAGEGLRTLIDDILDLSRSGRGVPLDLSAFDVLRESNVVCDALRPLADKRGLTLRIEAEPGLRLGRLGDPARFRQVLMALVGNALKFTEVGGVSLRLRAAAAEALLIEVQDSGPGIPAAKFDAIFEPYVQLDASTTRRHSGAGLGLAIARDVVQSMEGRITVESELGRGSVFRVTLPLSAVDTPPEQAQVEAADADISDLRVLIVDDIDMNRELLDLQVSTFGCRTQTAAGGPEALELLESSEFDLLLLDCQMPGMDGYAVAAEARARWPGRFLRIVAVTAHAQPGERSRCVEAGMDDLVAKPLAMQTLERVLRDSHALAAQLRGRRSSEPTP